MSNTRVFQVSAVATLLLSSLLFRILAQDVCATSSQPNPIAQQYPDAPTGTLNATIAIMPISLDKAKQLIPPQYAILEHAYRALLPDFPEGMYPVMMQAGLDHDIQLAAFGISIPDFQRIGWSFPFVDLLGDGYSSFTWAPAQMISSTMEIAINGSRDYGTTVYPSSFEPGCDAYSRLPNGTTTFTGTATDNSVHATLQFSPLDQACSNPFPVTFYQNITNQPIFGNGSDCDQQIRLFNSTINQGDFAPVPVKGTIFSNIPPVDASAGVDVFGMLVDTPFIEYNHVDCQSLKGYSG
ncbi:hypothetical protein N0V82_000042 [Gnomoniopsis sp. IMI 355080]|nr:hypothetical protein N0V82_000042 [Gnomoniopsis sp. IMI 355080]